MDRKKIVKFGIPLLLLISIPIIVYLVQHLQIFKPKAGGGGQIEAFGSNIVNLANGKQGFTLDAQGLPIVNVRLTSPFGPPSTANTTSNNSSTTNTTQSNGGQQNSTPPPPPPPPSTNVNVAVNSFQLSPAGGNQSSGSNFDVTVNFNAGSSDIIGVYFTINFDKARLQMTSFDRASTFDTAVSNDPPDNNNGIYKLWVNNSTSDKKTGNLVIGTAHFKAIGSGTAQVTLTPNEVNKVNSYNPPSSSDISTNGTSASFQIQ